MERREERVRQGEKRKKEGRKGDNDEGREGEREEGRKMERKGDQEGRDGERETGREEGDRCVWWVTR